MKIDWRKKLSSRKFWAALTAVVGAACVLFGVSDLSIEKACALVSACGVLAVYIFAEGYVDAKGVGNSDESGKKSE